MAVIFNGQPFDLKYLFRATLASGRVFLQTPEDVDSQDPKRSAFTELLRISKNDPIVRFELWSQEYDRKYAVDLTDGHFETIRNQMPTPFFQHEDFSLKDFKLIFYRNHQHDFNLQMEQQAHRVRYIIGWEANRNGKNWKYILNVD